jgi:hypothetical protein
MAKNIIPIQLLRSLVLGKRPNPLRLLQGQPGVNINSSDPGLYVTAFDTSQNPPVANLVKIGPCYVGSTAPASDYGYSKGELWLDTSDSKVGPALKIWDGSFWNWASTPTIVSDTTPNLSSYPDNSRWWSSETGRLYFLYNDGSSRQWVQVSSSVAY